MPTDEELSRASYWDQKYSESDSSEPFDWFRNFSALQTFLTRELPPPTASSNDSSSPRIIHFGSGNSTLPEDLLKLGYTNQLAVDFSQVVVDQMREKIRIKIEGMGGLAWMQWEWMDVRDMVGVEDSSIDVGIDKGTLDAMLFGSPWDPEPEVKENTSKYLKEVKRVLKKGTGKFVYITYRQKHFIEPILRQVEWKSLEVESLQKEDERGMLEYFGWTGVY